MQDQSPQEGTAEFNGQTPASSGQSPAQHAPPVVTGLVAVGLLIVLALIGGFLAIRARKKLLAAEAGSQSGGLLLDDMRAMLKRGEITQEEFDATRTSLMTKLRAEHAVTPAKNKKPAR